LIKGRANSQYGLREKSGISQAFLDSQTFSSFSDYGDEKLKRAKSVAINYYQHIGQNDGNGYFLLLTGDVGTGKTHLGTAVCVNVMKNLHIPVIYMQYVQDMERLQMLKWTDKDMYIDEDNKYKTARVLYIDDFLKGHVADADKTKVIDIIGYRYNQNLPTIISTEMSLEKLINWDMAVGTRIAERCKGFIADTSGCECHRLRV
jgi:DNA replication protein DnaC